MCGHRSHIATVLFLSPYLFLLNEKCVRHQVRKGPTHYFFSPHYLSLSVADERVWQTEYLFRGSGLSCFSLCRPTINILRTGRRPQTEEQSNHLEKGRPLFILAEFKNGLSGRPVGRVAPMFLSHSLVSFPLWSISQILLIRLAELNWKPFNRVQKEDLGREAQSLSIGFYTFQKD